MFDSHVRQRGGDQAVDTGPLTFFYYYYFSFFFFRSIVPHRGRSRPGRPALPPCLAGGVIPGDGTMANFGLAFRGHGLKRFAVERWHFAQSCCSLCEKK